MENKINIAEILKDCPKGMELDCTAYDNCTLEIVFEGCLFPIQIKTPENVLHLTKYGSFSQNTHSKCVIFPKGKTTWEGFQRPFKDGDVVAIGNSNKASQIFIFKEYIKEDYAQCYGMLDDDGSINFECDDYYVERFATEKEKQKLFDAIKAHGYRWNAETKTLEKLIEPKFDITTLKPFESRVLVRDNDTEKWKSNFWGFYDIDETMNYPYDCCGFSFAQCIPYNDDTKHLLGTTDDCDEFYKTWK